MATANLKRSKLPTGILKRSAGLVGGAVTDYFSDAMPTTASTVNEIKSAAAEISSTFNTTSQTVMPKVRNMKHQMGLKNVFKWFMGEADTFENFGNYDENLNFDTPNDESNQPEMQISELEEQTNKVAKSVVTSNQYLLEGQSQLTANLQVTIDSQTAVIQTGFNGVNDKLDQLIQVVSKNTSAMITAFSGEDKDDSVNRMMSSGKFDLGTYKKIIQSNVNSGPLGLALGMASTLTNGNNLKALLTPENIVKGIFSLTMNKKAPNVKKNLQALDEAVNDTIMQSLVRLGENQDNPLARIFGINASKRSFKNPSRSEVSLKAVPFDGVTKEYITQAIPGYLRKILVAVGGEDLIYDAKSRKFVRKSAIQKQFMGATTSTGGLQSQTDRVQKAFGNAKMGEYVYDKLINTLGYMQNENAPGTNMSKTRATLNSFSNQNEAYNFLKNLVHPKNKDEDDYIHTIAKQFANNPRVAVDLSMAVVRNNTRTNSTGSQFISEADAYGLNVSKLKSNKELSNSFIDEKYGRKAKVGSKGTDTGLTGTDYTNMALFEIYRLLDRGINVFQIGKGDYMKKGYPQYKEKYLKKPSRYKSKEFTATNTGSLTEGGFGVTDDKDNELLDKDKNIGDRFSDWSSKRGGELMKAIMGGNGDDVKNAFGNIMGDINGAIVDKSKQAIDKINQSFGNVTGYLKHKMFGTGYTYQNDEGKTIKVKENDKGGLFGFARDYLKEKFDNAKKSASKWFSSVGSMFDYQDKGVDKEDKTNSSKTRSLRRQVIATSVGAFAGAGILGGPIGVIVGSLAANALSVTGIGTKIHDFLFGNKDKKKLGAIPTLFNKVVDPIRYQFQKTGHSLAKTLKNKIIGPLSDIGVAIKDRIASQADSTFGKVFKTIGKIILAPFKGFGKLIMGAIKLPFQVMGGLIRGGTSVAGSLIGGAEEGAAGLIAGRKSTHTYIDENGEQKTVSTRDYIRQRKKQRKQDAKEDRFDNYKTWKGKEDERRAKWMQKLADYTKEDENLSKDTNDKTKNIDKNVGIMTEEATKRGSLFTHDQGLHDRLDTIIGLIKGKPVKDTDDGKKPVDAKTSNNTGTVIDGKTGAKLTAAELEQKSANENIKNSTNNAYANAAMSSGMVIGMNGDIDNDDVRDLNNLGKEAAKQKSDPSVAQRLLNSVLKHNKGKGEDNKNERKSLLEKLADLFGGKDGILGILKKILLGAGILTGIYGIVQLIKSGNEIIQNVLGNISDIANSIKDKLHFNDKDGKGDNDPSTSDDYVTRGENIATASGDTKQKHWAENLLPFKLTYHRDNDAAGNVIVNQDATRDNNVIYGVKPFVKAVRQDMNYKNSLSARNNAIEAMKNDTAYTHQAYLDMQGLEQSGQNVKNEYLKAKGNTQSTGVRISGYEPLDKRTMTKEEYKKYNRLQRQHGKRYTEPTEVTATEAFNSKGVQSANAEFKSKAEAKERYNEGRQAVEYDNKIVQEENKKLNSGQLEGSSDVAGNTVKEYGHNALYMLVSAGMSDLGGRGVGAISGAIAGKVTGNKQKAREVQQTATNVGTTVISAGLTREAQLKTIYNQTAGKLPGGKQKTGLVEKVTELIEKLFGFLASHFKAAKFLQSAIGKVNAALNKVYQKTIGAVTEKAALAIQRQLAKHGVQIGLEAATGGLIVAAAGVVGGLSGLCSTEHLFHVVPGAADGRMRAIAVLLKGVLGALEFTASAGTLVSLFRALDDTIVKGIFGKSFEEELAEILYVATGGSKEGLKGKQKKLSESKKDYENTFGTTMNDSAFNDLVNSGGLIDKIWRGNVKTKNGKVSMESFDEAGARKNGGLSSFIFGNEQEYTKDEHGNIIRNKQGGAVKAVDANGNKIKKNTKWGDKLSAGLNGVKRFFTGGDEYKTDSKGQALVDSEGNYVVKRKKQSIFGKVKNFFAGGKSTQNLTREEAEKNVQDRYGFSGPIMINGQPAYYSSVWHKYYSQSDYNAYVDEEQRNGTKTVKEKNIFGKVAGIVKSGAKKVGGAVKKGIKEFGAGIKDKAVKLADDVKNSKVGKAFGEIGDKFTGWLSGVVNFGKAIITEKKDVMDQLNNPDSTGSSLWTIKTKVDDSHPLSGLFKAILVGARLSMIPTMFVRRIGIGIKDVAIKAFNKVSKFNSNVGKSVSKVNEARNKGDIPGMFSAAEVINDDSVVSPFGTVIAGAGAVVNTPIAGAIWLGKTLVKGVKNIAGGIANFASDMSGVSSSIRDAELKGDIKGMFSAAKLDTENPVESTFGTILAKAGAVTGVPLAGTIWIGKKIGNVIKKTANSIVSFASDMSSVNAGIKDAGLKGDIKGMFSAAKLDTENPITSTFGTIIAKVGAATWVPLAGTIWAGKKLWSALKKPLKVASDARSTLNDNLGTVADAAKEGEVKQVLYGIKWQDNGENPLNGLMKGIFTAARFTYAPSALLHWAGSKISKFFTNAVDNAKADHSTYEDEIDKLKDYAKDGKTSKIMSASISTTKGDPLSLIYKAGFGVSQIFYGMSSIAHKIGNGFKDVVDSIHDKIGGWIKNIGDKVKGGINAIWDWLKGDTDDEPELDMDSKSKGGSISDPRIPSAYSGMGGGNEGGNPLSTGFKITSGFGNREKPFSGMHKGVDLMPTSPDASVLARYGGKVSYVKRNVKNSDTAHKDSNGSWKYTGGNSGGNEVWIDTPSGYRIKNMHLAAGSIPSNLHRGSEIIPGETIGKVGSTGWSTGKHLHYQIEQNGKPINPISKIKNGNGISVGGMGGVDTTKWLETVKAVKKAYAASGTSYHADNSHNFNVTIGGKTLSCRPDCSGFVSACLRFYGVMDSTLSSANFANVNDTTMKKTGFTPRKWTSWQDLQPGDIIAVHGGDQHHVEIFAGNQQGSNQHTVYNAGSTSAIQQPGPTHSSKTSYQTVWSPGAAGSGAVSANSISIDGTTSSSTQTDSATALTTALNNLGTTFLSQVTGGIIGMPTTDDSSSAYVSSSSGAVSANSSNASYTPSDASIAAIEKQDLGKFTTPTAAQMNAWINKVAPKNSTFRNNGDVFLKASKVSGLDPRYILAHAAVESTWGTSHIARTKNNYFGIGAFNSSPYASAYKFGSGLANGISGGAKWIADHYYNSKYQQKTLHDMLSKGHVYAQKNDGTPNWEWADSIAKIMKNGPSSASGGTRSDIKVPFMYSDSEADKLFDQSQAMGGSNANMSISSPITATSKKKVSNTLKRSIKSKPATLSYSQRKATPTFINAETAASKVSSDSSSINDAITLLQGIFYELKEANDIANNIANNTEGSNEYLKALGTKSNDSDNKELSDAMERQSRRLKQKATTKKNPASRSSAKTVAAMAAP